MAARVLTRLVLERALATKALGARFYSGSSRPVPTILRNSSAISSRYPQKSVVISRTPSETRASVLLEDPTKLLTCPDEETLTIPSFFQRGLRISGNGPCLGTYSASQKKYEYLSYKETKDLIHCLYSAMVNVGLDPKNSTFVGIQSKNRKEQTLAIAAISFGSMIGVPVHATVSDVNLHYIMEQTEVQLMFCETSAMVETALKMKPPTLRHIVAMDPFCTDLHKLALKMGVKLWTFDEFTTFGRKNKCEPKLPRADDIFMVVYTSGTTGLPKGVIMTHHNIAANHAGGMACMGKFNRDGGRHMSYLPPAHIYEIMMQVGALYHGRSIAYYRGDIDKFEEDLQLVKPTTLPLVPRLLNRLYKKAVEEINGNPVKKLLLERALRAKERMLMEGIVTKNSIWDHLVFKGVQKALGGAQECITCGSAPVSSEIAKFYARASGAGFFEAHGLTEGCCCHFGLPYETDAGFVGAPTPIVHVRLRDVPEMNYFVKDGIGEVCFRGPGVTPGYFKNPQATLEGKEDEWLLSGDIGHWLPNGYMKLVDRRKHIFKTSQGVYIAPEKIESIYLQCELITQIFVEGFSDKDYIVAVAVPDASALNKICTALKMEGLTEEERLRDTKIRSFFLQELREVGKAHQLTSLEQIRNLALTSETFSPENDLLTPTLKLKRNVAREKFKDAISQIYSEPALV